MFSTIKNLGLGIAMTMFSVTLVNAQDAPMWKLDKSHSSVNFSIDRFFTTVTGNFTKFDGNIRLDLNYLNGSTIEFTIASNSVNTNNEQRDKHLQSPDFFDAEKYPKMTFKSVKIEKKSNKEYLVYGKLTIKAKTIDVILPMKITGEMEHPMMKGVFVLGVSISTTIDRTDFGVGTGDWAATAVVSDEVKIHIPMDLVRKN